MLLIHPNSYQAKESIKSLGGRWNAKEKGWNMPSQESFDKAFDACENAAKERPLERFWTNDDDYSWLTAPVAAPAPIPAVGQDLSLVKSGLVFSRKERGSIASSEWVVLCGYQDGCAPALADDGDLLCGCLSDRLWLYLSPSEIASHPWTGEIMPLPKAKELYDRFMEVR